MNILVLADNFTPEIVATSFRTHEHAKVWLEQGHTVTVVTCAPNWPQGQVFPGYRNRLYQEEWIDGIRVIRVWSYMTANKGFLKRTLDYVSFMMSAVLWCWRFPRFDVVLATSPQFFTALAGWLISVLRWRPWVFEVRDLWPASIAAVGASKGRLITWLERLELFLYRRANRVLVVTEAFREDLKSRGITAQKIDLATNGVDLANFSVRHVAFDARQRLGIPSDAFVTGYVGTTGMAHGLETLLDAVEACRKQRHIHFIVIGEGAERSRLEDSARQRGLSNLRFLDRVPHAEMPAYLSAFDLPIIHLRPDPVFRTVIPSKLFEFMAMRLPVLMAVEGEAAGIVSDSGCGVCIPSGDATLMASTIQRLASDRSTLKAMGDRGHLTVVQCYGRRVKALEALSCLESARSGCVTNATRTSHTSTDATVRRAA